MYTPLCVVVSTSKLQKADILDLDETAQARDSHYTGADCNPTDMLADILKDEDTTSSVRWETVFSVSTNIYIRWMTVFWTILCA